MQQLAHPRPVWLFSMDSEHFDAAPTTTGTLKAYFHHYGNTAPSTDVRLLHFATREKMALFAQQQLPSLLAEARVALDNGHTPIAGISVYTWNAAEFLDLCRTMKQALPELVIIAGGPHVQQAEDYLFDEAIDVVVLGEGEITLSQFLDCASPQEWHSVAGLAFLHEGSMVKTGERARIRDLSTIPSPLEVVPITNENGEPLYDSICYETSRGCPFTCAFCEWGTGAIGTKMIEFPLARVRSDFEKSVQAGIRNIWLADSNFGALKQDMAKAQVICELKDRYGLPSTFATSWSKKHSARVQDIALLLHRHGLLPHYQLALQTLTPLALKLSNRENMSANEYEPIAKKMAASGVPIAAELIWGLPGDTLASFETGLDRLLTVFPNVNIFGYTLLPGTEFYKKRHEYKIQTIPVAGYGKAKGEYVIGCHTFGVDEGIQGYALIVAHMIMVHGYVLPLTTRWLALSQRLSTSRLMRTVVHALAQEFQPQFGDVDLLDPIALYEQRSLFYIALLLDPQRTNACIARSLQAELLTQNASDLWPKVKQLLALDQAFVPRGGDEQMIEASFNFDAAAVRTCLDAMEVPTPTLWHEHDCTLVIAHRGGAGVILREPDAGCWLKGNLLEVKTCADHNLLAVAQIH